MIMSISVKPQPPPKPHSLVKSVYSVQRRNGAAKPTKVQDKTIEDLVLDELYYDIVRNLPADDVAILMDEHKLLTSGQRDHYRMMKANHQPDVEKSEYLIDCLRKGEPGFLQKLCTILRTLPPSSYIADKIQDKVKELSSKPLILKPQRPESASRVKSDIQWKIEYRKLEMKTRMQLQAKDREIKRLRKVVRHLQKENSDHLEQVFSEMKSQVENVAKWIDLKSKSLSPHSSSLLKIALSHDGKYGDLYSSHESQLSSSDMSSNQSTLERHHRRKESLESYQPSSTCPPSSCESSQVATPTTPVRARNYVEGDLEFLPIHNMLTKNFNNHPTLKESDMSYITRLLKKESEAMLKEGLHPDSHDAIDHSVSEIDISDEGVSHSQTRYNLNDWRSTLATTSVRARTRSMSAPFVSTESLSSTMTINDTNESDVPAAASDELHIPSTVKSNTTTPKSSIQGSPTQQTFSYKTEADGLLQQNGDVSAEASDELHTPSTVKSNTTSPKSSIQESPTQQKFKYGEVMVQQEQEPTADLIAVFRKIQGREFLIQ